MEQSNKIKLYWARPDESCRALKAFLLDAGIEHDEHQVNLWRDEPEVNALLSKHLPGVTAIGSNRIPKEILVPWIMHDGQFMQQAVALMRFLVNSHPELASHLYPPDVPMQRYQIDKWCDFCYDQLRPAFKDYFQQVFLGSRPLSNADHFVMKRATERQWKVLDKLEAHFGESGTKFIAGDHLSIADYVIFTHLQDTRYLRLDLAKHPKLVKYQADVMAASPGIFEIHKPGGDWARKDLAATTTILRLLQN